MIEDQDEQPTFRYGGDEFAILLPGHDKKSAAIVVERLRLAVESRGIEDGGCTISLGVASLSESGNSIERLVYLADAAMFQAEAAGRNRVETQLRIDAPAEAA